VQYLHCLCCFWRAEDLLKHLLDDHVDHLLMSAGSADTVTCKWEACLELLAANTKVSLVSKVTGVLFTEVSTG